MSDLNGVIVRQDTNTLVNDVKHNYNRRIRSMIIKLEHDKNLLIAPRDNQEAKSMDNIADNINTIVSIVSDHSKHNFHNIVHIANNINSNSMSI